MGKRKRKLTAAEKAAKKKRREEYETIFINGKMKRVRRPPSINGMSVDEFIRRNADPIFLHQEGMWEDIEVEDAYPSARGTAVTTSSGRELVSFINIERGDDLIVGYAITLEEPGEIASLILQRTPKYEWFMPEDERGVKVWHELHRRDDREFARRIVVDGTQVDIETPVRTYRLELREVEFRELASARRVLQRMHSHGGFSLTIR